MKLEQPADLYDDPYQDDLTGTVWGSRRLPGLTIRVLGEGVRSGTASVESVGDPTVRQDDLPVSTLKLHYRPIAPEDAD